MTTLTKTTTTTNINNNNNISSNYKDTLYTRSLRILPLGGGVGSVLQFFLGQMAQPTPPLFLNSKIFFLIQEKFL